MCKFPNESGFFICHIVTYLTRSCYHLGGGPCTGRTGTGHTLVMRSLTLTLTEPSNTIYVDIRKLTKQYNPVRGLVCAGYWSKICRKVSVADGTSGQRDLGRRAPSVCCAGSSWAHSGDVNMKSLTPLHVLILIQLSRADVLGKSPHFSWTFSHLIMCPCHTSSLARSKSRELVDYRSPFGLMKIERALEMERLSASRQMKCSD